MVATAEEKAKAAAEAARKKALFQAQARKFLDGKSVSEKDYARATKFYGPKG